MIAYDGFVATNTYAKYKVNVLSHVFSFIFLLWFPRHAPMETERRVGLTCLMVQTTQSDARKDLH